MYNAASTKNCVSTVEAGKASTSAPARPKATPGGELNPRELSRHYSSKILHVHGQKDVYIYRYKDTYAHVVLIRTVTPTPPTMQLCCPFADVVHAYIGTLYFTLVSVVPFVSSCQDTSVSISAWVPPNMSATKVSSLIFSICQPTFIPSLAPWSSLVTLVTRPVVLQTDGFFLCSRK